MPANRRNYDKEYYRNNREKALLYRKDYYSRNKRAFRRRLLMNTFGLTLEDYDRMLSEQQGGCAICGTAEAGGRGFFHVDHDHETEEIRGLLCANCNLGIGNMADSPEILEEAARYLRKQQGSWIRRVLPAS